MVGAIAQTLGVPIDIPLRTWAVGGLLLSFPTSWLVDAIVKKDGVRWGFALELVNVAASYAWLTWGTVLLSTSQGAERAVPLLWWTSFAQCILSWSIMTTAIASMVLMTVLTLLLNSQKP